MLREALRVQADVYHFHDPELIPVGLALKMLGKRVVYDAHEDVAKSILGKSYLAGWLRRPLAATVNLLEKGASRAFDLVVVAAGGIQTSFRGHAHTLLIRNYPIQESHASLEPAVRDDGRFVVAYAGGLTAERGAVEMVEAIARVPARFEPRLVICGKYWPARLEERVRSMPGFERVDYRGWLSPGRVAAELHRADVGLVLQPGCEVSLGTEAGPGEEHLADLDQEKGYDGPRVLLPRHRLQRDQEGLDGVGDLLGEVLELGSHV
jgi:glycosyltransferase involved in cell wall biosynthesis